MRLPLASAARSLSARRYGLAGRGQVRDRFAPALHVAMHAALLAVLLAAPAAAPCLTQAKAPTPPAETPASGQQPPTAQPAPAQPQQVQPASPAEPAQSGEITEDQLRQLLVGKPLFLRGGYLGDSLSFTEHGDPTGHPAAGSYTLSGVEIDKVHLTKHKVELIGARYGLHFLGALPNEDPSTAVDRVKITPKKKVLKITIDREQIVKPKKIKNPFEKDKKSAKDASASSPKDLAASSETDAAAPASAQPAETAETRPAAGSAPPAQPDHAPDQADRPADQASVTSTTSPAHANRILREALDRIFAPGLDDKLKAQMPAFWQLYYQAQASGVDYRPSDPAVLRSSAVDRQARVVTSIAPDSNEFAQASGIAGRALYRAVIGPDGKPGEIAVVRPIGFGLDENAIAAIRKATFQPAAKGGQPVAQALDLAVVFRIYSKRTSVASTDGAQKSGPVKPGPYSVREP